MPVPPPVMSTVWPAWFKDGLVGEIAGYDVLWMVDVKSVEMLSSAMVIEGLSRSFVKSCCYGMELLCAR
jgi:hypothetical protein